MSILYDTKTKRKFLDYKCSFEDRTHMYHNDPDRIYECCCREKNRVQLKLTNALHFYPIDRNQVHESDCERSSEFQENSIYNKAFYKRDDGTFFASLDYDSDNLRVHDNISRDFPNRKNYSIALSFPSFAKKINMAAYERMMKTNRKDKNGNHATLDRKYIERYIWSVLQSTYILYKGKEISIHDLEKCEDYQFAHNYHILDRTRKIEKRKTKNGNLFYLVPIMNLKGFGKNCIIIKEKDFNMAKSDFENEYNAPFDYMNNKIMMFIYGEKSSSSTHEINPWKPLKLCFFMISDHGLYSSSKDEALIYSSVEHLLIDKEKDGKYLQFFKPYIYNPSAYPSKRLPDGIIKNTFKSNNFIIVQFNNESEFQDKHSNKKQNRFIWNVNLNNVLIDGYIQSKIQELSKLINSL